MCVCAYYPFSVENPPLPSCADLYLAGFKVPGHYWIDPSGNLDSLNAIRAYCDEGWTHILRRGQDDSDDVVNL